MKHGPMNEEQTARMASVSGEILNERLAQHAKWGEQNRPNGTGHEIAESIGYIVRAAENPGRFEHLTTTEAWAELAKEYIDYHSRMGNLSYAMIFVEEFFEAMNETDPVKLREELLQCGAVAQAWVKKIDRDFAKAAAMPPPEYKLGTLADLTVAPVVLPPAFDRHVIMAGGGILSFKAAPGEDLRAHRHPGATVDCLDPSCRCPVPDEAPLVCGRCGANGHTPMSCGVP